MASQVRLANETVSIEAAALNAQFNGAILQIMDGIQPVNGDTGPIGNTLVGYTLPNPCFITGINGVLMSDTITPEAAQNSGTATWFRITSHIGFGPYYPPLMDGSVGVSGSNCDLILNSTAIIDSAIVTLTSFTYTVTKQ
jgi:hypothetical protein